MSPLLSSATLSRAGNWCLSSYDFEYEDDDDDEEGDIGIENKYYNAKQMKVDNPEEAVDEFLGVPALEQDKSDWGVKDHFLGWEWLCRISADFLLS